MDQNTQPEVIGTQAPVAGTMPSAPAATEGHKKVGPIISILAVILVLILGALYLFASRSDEDPIPTDESMTAQTTEVPAVTGTSDDVTSLEADLDASTEGLDEQNF